MPTINLNLSLEQLAKVTLLASILGVDRGSYIRQAIDNYNKNMERQILAQQFKGVSARCRHESLRVCHEFDGIDYIPE